MKSLHLISVAHSWAPQEAPMPSLIARRSRAWFTSLWSGTARTLVEVLVLTGAVYSPAVGAVGGTATIADGTTPVPGSQALFKARSSNPACSDRSTQAPFDASGAIVSDWSLYCTGGNPCRAVSYTIQFSRDDAPWPWGNYYWYLWANAQGSISCDTACSCAGSFAVDVYSAAGNVKGELKYETGAPGPSSQRIWAVPNPAAGGGSARWTETDQDGVFDFALPDATWGALFKANNWGLGAWLLDPPAPYPGPGTIEYALIVSGSQAVPPWDPEAPRVQVVSGQLTERDLVIPCPPSGCPLPDDPSERPDEDCPDPAPAPSSKGRPVSVTTGNVFLDQVDGRLAVLRGQLVFKRAYNSFGAAPGRFGAFGPGWSHNWERRISTVSATRLALRRADGVITYYDKADGSVVFTPTTPWRKDRWIEVEPDGRFTLQFRAGGSEVYAQQGHLLSVSDSFGATTSLGYDAQGRLTSISGPGVRGFALEYEGATGRISALSANDGVNWLATYTYDPSGRLESVTYPDSDDEGTDADGGFTFTYHPTLGLLTTVTDLTGRISEAHEYYASGLGKTSELADGIERLTVGYSPGQTTVTDARGNVTTYDWSLHGGMKRVTRIAGPCSSCGGGTGEVTQWEYDQHGRVEARIDAEGRRTEYKYDEDSGRVETENLPLDGHLISYTYHPDGRLWTRTEPNGKVTTWTYVPAGLESVRETTQPGEPDRLTTFAYTSSRGLLETVTDPRGKVTLFEYDGIGDLLFMTEPLGTATPAPGDHVTAYEYDLLGRRVAVTDPLGHRTETRYNTLGQVIETRRIHFDETQTRHDLVTAVLYDQAGRRATVRDPLGLETSYTYDTYGRLQFVDQPPPEAGQPRPRTTYGYDAMSNLTSIKDAESNGTSRTTVNTYDAYNRLWTVTWPGPELRQEAYTYWPTGRLKTVTDRKGVISTYLYDELGRVRRREYSGATGGADTTPTEFTYDERGFLGHRTGAKIGATNRLEWDYDKIGQVRTERYFRTARGTPDSTVEYRYDLAGDRTQLKLDGQVFVDYVYDDARRLDTLTRGTAVFDFGYDDAHNRTSLLFPNQQLTQYVYDDVDRLKNLTVGSGGQPIVQNGYTYDDAGNRLTKSQLDYAEVYDYDDLYRLKHVDRSGTPTEDYSYDKVGNRLSSIAAPVWSYNDRNELQSYGGVSFAYDANGSLAQKSEGADVWLYEWTLANELKRVRKNGSAVAEFTYDALGRRVKKVAGATTTTFTYAGEDILKEVAGGVAKRYIHGPGVDEPLAVEDAAGVLNYFHVDALGSVLKMTDATGGVINSANHSYEAFGLRQAGASIAGYAYTGREWDPEIGLYYYRARYYDPKSGRFINEDPIRWLGGDENFYTYVSNSPVSFTDPLGLMLMSTSVDGTIRSGNVQNIQALLDTPGALTPAQRTLAEKVLRQVADHLRKLKDARAELQRLKDALKEATGPKSRRPIEEAIEELEKDIAGHVKEMGQRWKQCPIPPE